MSTCDHCGRHVYATAPSIFKTTEKLCADCFCDEKDAPSYATAKLAIETAAKGRAKNFQGIGMTVADIHFLRDRRMEREASAAA